MTDILMLMLALASAGAATQTPTPQPNPGLVRVFVQTDDDGEASELAARRESARDLGSALLTKRKMIAIVDHEDKADVVLDVLARGVTVPKVVMGIGARPGQPPGIGRPVRAVVLRVRLTFGEESVDFTNKNKPAESPRGWKSAADDLGDQIEKWIAARRAEILKRQG